MEILLLAPLGMLACMAGLAALGLPGKARSDAPVSPAPPAAPAAAPGPVRLPTPPAGFGYAMMNGKPVLVPAPK
jgi:hypothetical protein